MPNYSGLFISLPTKQGHVHHDMFETGYRAAHVKRLIILVSMAAKYLHSKF